MTTQEILNRVKEQYFEDKPNLQKGNSSVYRYNYFFQDHENDDISRLSWNMMCDYVCKSGNARLTLLYLCEILSHDLYCGDHKDALCRLLPSLKAISMQKSTSWANVFCYDDIENLYIVDNPRYKNSEDAKSLYFFLKYNNAFLKQLCYEVMCSSRKYNRWLTQSVLEEFEMSLGHYAAPITCITDFGERTFWEQVNYYRNKYASDSKKLYCRIANVIAVYRYIANTYPEHDFLSNATSLSRALLYSSALIKQIKQGYYVTTFNVNNDVGDYERITFLFKNYEKLSTQMFKDDYVSLDISVLKCSAYRKLLLKYYMTSPSITLNVWSGQINYIATALQRIYIMKSSDGYPNPNLTLFNNQEAVFIKNLMYDESLKLSTNNNRIGAIRRFLQWTSDTRECSFEDLFFTYLSQYEEPSQTTGHAIPEQVLIAINDVIAEKAKTDYIAKLCYGIFHILLQTEFRISQVCHLKTDCISPTVKPNQHSIRSNSKVSHGRIESAVITDLTCRHLQAVIDESESVRDECTNPEIKDYIFIYRTVGDGYRVINPAMFRRFLIGCCKEAGLSKTYSSADLRDTHMTKAFEHILRSGKSDLELKSLTRHKHIDTSKNHYIEIELEKMLEATYGIIIGDKTIIDPHSNIIDEIPSEFDNSESVVESGCGNCIAPNCSFASALPCLACKNFKTTVAHEKYFIKAIEGIEGLIDTAKTKHDKDDLCTIKLLYVLYLEAIYKKKEKLDL